MVGRYSERATGKCTVQPTHLLPSQVETNSLDKNSRATRGVKKLRVLLFYAAKIQFGRLKSSVGLFTTYSLLQARTFAYRNLQMKFTSLLPLVCAALALTSCKSTKQTTTEVRNLPELNIRPSDENAEQYRAAFTVQHNILHTALDVRFDWTKKYLYGKAVLTVRPHFYPSNRLILNARGMQILDVRILKGGDSVKVNYDF